MANVLDLKRRIRSVKNTRQITKAMKMVSAAKLRRAQERAMQARPYAQMLANVLQSLVRRTDLYGGEGGDILNPLLVERPEKNILVLVIAGDKGFAGGFNANVGKAAQRFVDARRLSRTATDENPSTGEANIDIEPVGRKARDLFRRKYPDATWEHVDTEYDNGLSHHIEEVRHRAFPIEVTHDQSMLLAKLNFADVDKAAHSIIDRYERGEIDAVYLVYNEFKSVIAQRVVVEKLLPIRKLGSPELTVLEEMTEEQKEAAARSAEAAGVSLNEPEGVCDAEGSRDVWHGRCGLPVRRAAGAAVQAPAAPVCDDADLPCAAGEFGQRTRRANDGDGCGEQQCERHDRWADADDESGAAGCDYKGDY